MKSPEHRLPSVSIIMYNSAELSRPLCVRLALSVGIIDLWQLERSDFCGIISLTDRTELSLHLIAAILRLNAPIPEGPLHGTNFFRKRKRERGLPQLDRSSSVEAHTGGRSYRGSRPSAHRCILCMPELRTRGQRGDGRDA